MTTEQRETIDRLQELVNLRKRKNNIKHDTCICSTEDLDTALSLIKEQQEETDKYKTLYERALSDLVKADKQIDLMANYIVNLIKYNNPEETREVEEIKQYFAELASRSDGRATDS